MKTCTKCKGKKIENHENFPRAKSFKSGFNSMCRSCLKIKQKEYRQRPENKEKHKIKQREWRKNNIERARELSRNNWDKNKDRLNFERNEKYKNDPKFKAKKKESEKRYVESGGRRKQQTQPNQMEKSRLRSAKRRLNGEKREHDNNRMAEWRQNNKEYLKKLHKSTREELKPSYVAQSMRISVKDLDPKIYETKKIIIELKRELKNNNVKIR
tara:strand:+ start:206 stop:844 length:639 start_codon:yes stop_codon:yes gene_type:complete